MFVTVYCGSHDGFSVSYQEAAERLGQLLAKHHDTLVYGGGRIGLMGVLADQVLLAGGQVIGVMSEVLALPERVHTQLTQLEVVADMAQRKARMATLGDLYVALPGGPGTLEEITEMISHRRIHLHDKPCFIVNTDGFYDALGDLFDAMVKAGFMTQKEREMIQFVAQPEQLETWL